MSKTIEQEVEELAIELNWIQSISTNPEHKEVVWKVNRSSKDQYRQDARKLIAAGYIKVEKPPVVEAGEGVKWPERSNRPMHGFEDSYVRGIHHGANKMHDAFTTILKQKGLL